MMSPDELARKIQGRLRQGPIYFEDILLDFPDESYQMLLRAWGRLREQDLLGRELETGRYVAKDEQTEGD
jgi:hypothetical protein